MQTLQISRSIFVNKGRKAKWNFLEKLPNSHSIFDSRLSSEFNSDFLFQKQISKFQLSILAHKLINVHYVLNLEKAVVGHTILLPQFFNILVSNNS